MSYTNERLQALAQGLLDATRDQRVEWTVADDTNTSFSFARTSGAVVISSKDQDGAFPYVMEVFDPAGRKVESLETGWFTDENTMEDYPFEWNETLRLLFETARAQALNIDSVINALLQEIKPPKASDDIPF
jgi:hypothetical protein